jgi:transcriptional regulator
MYVPAQFEESDLSVLHALIAERPLGAWVTLSQGELVVNHIPFLLDATRGEWGTLMGHVARANPVWKTFSTSLPSLVVFQGPEAYITPSSYPSKAENGQAVPTWNYAVVHAHGLPHAREEREWLFDHVTRQTDVREAAEAVPWHVSDAPVAFIEGLLRGIVGIEIPISKLVGKWKVSQNRTEADRLGAAAGLTARGDASALSMAELIRSRIKAKPGR